MKISIKLLVSLFLLISFFNSYAQEDKGIDFKQLDKYLQKSLDEWKIPGMAVAIVQGDSIAFAKGYGIREFGKPDKVDTKTLFAVASNTKSFTSAALSQLVEKGIITWDDKVIDYLPYFQLYDPYVTNEMTIRDLLCHRTGLETFSGDLLWYETNYTAEEVIKRAKYLKPTYSFRSHFGYSNIMFSVAGEILKTISEKTWEDYVRTEFFNRLGMSNSLLSISEIKLDENIAIPHHSELSKPHLPIKYMAWDNVAPAASIISNVEDMSKWLIMHMNEGVYKADTILNENQIWEMQTLHTPNSSSKSWSKNFPTKHFAGYGLGWSLFDYQGVKVVGHGGGADGMISQSMFVPEADFGMIVLTNNINYLPAALMYHVLEDYFGKPTKDWSSFYYNIFKYFADMDKKEYEKKQKSRVLKTKPSLNLKDYVGTYGGELYGNAEVRLEDGKLVLDFLPSDILIGDLSHWHFDTFVIKLRNSPTLPEGTVNFILGTDGKVEELRVDIPNPDFYFTELEFKKITK